MTAIDAISITEHKVNIQLMFHFCSTFGVKSNAGGTVWGQMAIHCHRRERWAIPQP